MQSGIFSNGLSVEARCWNERRRPGESDARCGNGVSARDRTVGVAQGALHCVILHQKNRPRVITFDQISHPYPLYIR